MSSPTDVISDAISDNDPKQKSTGFFTRKEESGFFEGVKRKKDKEEYIPHNIVPIYCGANESYYYRGLRISAHNQIVQIGTGGTDESKTD